MAPANDPSSEDSKKSPEIPANTPKGYEKVVDELRNVLSDLNKFKSEDLSQEPPSPADEFLQAPQLLDSPDDLESDRLGKTAFHQAPEPTSTDNPSDADFWKGNVLGWPDSPPENSKTPAPTPVDSPISSQGYSPFQEDFSIPSSPTSPLTNSGEMDPPIEPFSGFAKPAPVHNPFDVPPPPVAPDEELVSNDDQRTAFLGNLRIPVPGTLHQVSGSSAKKKSDSTLEEMDIQAKHQIQIACLFPDGQEDLANNFMSKLKMSAAKAVGCPDFEIVLSTPWFLTQIDLHSWKKAASLSGAHFLFVLAFKKDKELFKEFSKIGHADEVRARLVFLEQIDLKTLYADLLSDVIRNFNGKG